MGRIVKFNTAGYVDENGTPHYISRGQVVDLPPKAEKELDELGALVPEGATLAQVEEDQIDAYRAPRGDTVAAQKLRDAAAEGRASGGIVNLGPEAGLADRIKEGLNAEETIALAENDPAKADVVLAAEHEATGGEPRKTVVEPLEKLKAQAQG